MNIEFQEIRARSLLTSEELGYRINRTLPLINGITSPRELSEIAKRVFILGAVVAGVLGDFPTPILREWIEREGLSTYLTLAERNYFEGHAHTAEDLTDFRDQVESLWALTWVLGKAESMDFQREAHESLGMMLPDIEAGENVSRFLQGAEVRATQEIVAACDLSYCLHWAIVDAALRREPPPGVIEPYVVVYRRRALEWVLSRARWDDIPLDT